MPTTGVFIVDNEYLVRSNLKALVMEAGLEVIGDSEDGSELLKILKQPNHIDLLLLDIHLGDDIYDGIDLAQSIREFTDIPILFITSLPMQKVYGRRSMISHSRELHKPPSLDDLNAQANDLLSEYRKRPLPKESKANTSQYLFLPIGKSKSLHRIDLHKIAYLEADDTTCLLFLIEGGGQPFRVKKTLKEVGSKIDSTQFVRISRKAIVNFAAVTNVDLSIPTSVHIGEKQLFVGEAFKANFLASLK